MRAVVTLMLGIVAVVLGNYWFNPYLPICRLPVEYSIDTFDERFGLSREEAENALLSAEVVWEKALGRDDVFTFVDKGGVRVSFIYDERQREAEAAERAREDLATRGDANDVLVELHRRLVEEYDAQAAEYENRLSNYEAELSRYNNDVERYNREGGAPPDVYEELERWRTSLENERLTLNGLSSELNDLAEQINSVGEKGNDLLGEYNERVNDFNDNFAHGHEYTQGDYRAKDINIYSFVSKEELTKVLAHELGHSLSIGHVEEPKALMYYLLKDQPSPIVLAEADIAAFNGACTGDFLTRLWGSVRTVYNSLII